MYLCHGVTCGWLDIFYNNLKDRIIYICRIRNTADTVVCPRI